MRLHALRRRSLGRGALRGRRLAAELRVLPIFACRLQATLVPERANGSGTPTFTRASTAYQTDFEGKLNLALSGEARVGQGARRVANFLTTLSAKSEDLTATGGWGVASATSTIDAADFPTGTTKSTSVTASAQFGGVTIANALTIGKTYRFRYWAKSAVGGEVVWVGDGIGTGGIDNVVTTVWQLYASPVIVAGNATLKVGIGTVGGGTVKFSGIQPEDITGQVNQNPSEYVSVGILSAPFHGANVDGVKLFSTLNGNTVASNVVTEATGAHIDSSQAAAAGGVTAGVVDAYGPLGYLAEGARTNDILQSNTLGTTWTISNAADMNAVAANAYVSVDGTTTMDKLQPKATTAVHSLDQAFTFTAAKYTTAVDLRYVSATPQRWAALILNDGTTTWGASFDLLNGVVGAVSAGATSGIEATAQANVYRVWVTNTANAAAAAGTVKISLNATDTATLESAARAGTETLGAGMVQHEVGTFKSSRITTTTVAVARNASVDQYVSAGNIPASNNDFVVYGESAFNPVPTAASYFLWASYVDADNYTAVLWDGTNLIARKRIAAANHDAIIAFTPTAGIAFKWAARFTSTIGTDIFLNGTKGTNDATNTACQIGANFQWSADGNGANQPFGTLRNTRIFDRPRFTQVLVDMTTDGLMR